MFILPAFNQTIQRLAGPGLGHNTRHVYVGDGIGDVVRPLISAGAKAAGRLAPRGWLLLATSVLNSFKLQSPWPCARLQRSPRQVRTFCGRVLKSCLCLALERRANGSPRRVRAFCDRGLKTCLHQERRANRRNDNARLYNRGLKTCLHQGHAALDRANDNARLYSKRHDSCCPGVPLKIWTP